MDIEETNFDLLDEGGVREAVLAAFSQVADAQQGRPEILATSTRANPDMFKAAGAFSYLAEHVGDLTHRLTQHPDRTSFGYAAVGEKVRRALRYFRNGYGLPREVDGNIRNNHVVHLDSDPGPHLSLGDFRAAFARGAALYADAHAGVPVLNAAQWHAREAAVALGRLEFDVMERHLEAIEERLDRGVDAWRDWAGQVHLRDGAPVSYDPGVVSSPAPRRP